MTVEATAPATDTADAFSCSKLFVEYRTRDKVLRVLEDVGFSCAQGEFLSILGPSGTGKTTLLRILAGLLTPGQGSSVRFRGQEITGPPTGVGIVFQNYAASLLQWRTVERNVALGLEGRTSKSERDERVREALELVGLADRGSDYPWQLSGGMQQRVQIARSLVMRPEVLLMDEPFGALDAMTKAQLQDELLKVAAVTGATVVFVTHDIDEAVYLSDRVLVLAGKPATVGRELRIDLPRPRDQVATKELPAYLAARHRVYEALRAESEAQAETQSGSGAQ
ncbi:ABC transporter ATP-binding protein [Amycolatopsis rhabdoformis]|uniref:ABC transporter ATP-binding protein n=1 Tax=Amycolatopsis rhabdoformis TaxID=1448059 RepID=A0ABZ1IDP3_9PSEU|nr:ABC transporter ATP-binding protein [Amycolatopsis rhabdoformis]WSE31555.1 ABC transporter ATP-binding protein [Amycolatopsis rhabdoformis]